MNNLNKTLIVVSALAFWRGISTAETGSGGLPGYWLGQGAGARALAMGGAYTAISDDASALYWNPAGLALLRRKELSLTHVQLFEDTRNDLAVYAHPFKKLAVGLGGAQLFTGKIIKTDALNNPVGEFSDSYTTVLAGIGGEAVEKRLYIGFAARRVGRTMDTYSASGYGLDAGVLADLTGERTPAHIRLGLGVKNLVAPKLKRDVLTDEFPPDLSAGAAVTLLGGDLVIGADARKKTGGAVRPAAGVEYNFGTLSLRAGYDKPDPAFGFGVRLGRVALDYALLASREKELGLSHRFSLALKLGRDPDLTARIDGLVSDGRTFAEAKKWAEAEASFRKALELDADRRDARGGLAGTCLARADEALAGGQPDRRAAMAWCGEALKADPQNQRALARLAELNLVAVADFMGKNVSQADASIVADFLRTELVATGAVNIMDRNNMAAVLEEQKFQNSGCTGQECAVQLGKLLNVSRMVVGALSNLMDTYYITASLVDVESGKVLVSYDAEAASSGGLKEACGALAKKLAAYGRP